MADRFALRRHSLKNKLGTISELGYRKISWFVIVSQINYLPLPSASGNNWCARHWEITTFCSTSQPRPIIASLRASYPIWASEASLARTRERAAKPRGAGERRACNHPSQIFICTSPRRREIPLAEKWRSGNQSWLITGWAGTRFVCVSNLVLKGIRLVPRTCFSPQSRRARFLGPLARAFSRGSLRLPK